MKKIRDFIKQNRLIVSFFIISICLIVTYILSMDLPEWFCGAEKWFNVIFQLAVGYIINFIFYITQVYIPNNKRVTSVRKCIKIRVQNLINAMNDSIFRLGEIYLNNHTGNKYTKDELKQIETMLKFGDSIRVFNASTNNYFCIKEWIWMCINKTEKEINTLYAFYGSDISPELMEMLEKILKSSYHKFMPTILMAKNSIDFSGSDGSTYIEYYDILSEVREIFKKEYKDIL